MLARYKPNATVAGAPVAVLHHLSEFNERMPPIYGVEHLRAQLLEPRLVKEMQGLFVFIFFGVDDLEGSCHDKALSLPHASRKMCVYLRIPIDVVEPLAVGLINVYGELPCPAPICDVLTCECVCGPL